MKTLNNAFHLKHNSLRYSKERRGRARHITAYTVRSLFYIRITLHVGKTSCHLLENAPVFEFSNLTAHSQVKTLYEMGRSRNPKPFGIEMF